MRAIVVTAASPELVELSNPSPGPGEVVIEVRAAAVNPVDIGAAEGLPRRLGWVEPDAALALGWDVAGRVAATGAGVQTEVGTAVAALVPGFSRGTFAEFVVVPASDVASLPAGLDPESACAVGLVGLTAAQSLDLIETPPGKLLVTGAAGGVGAATVVLARRAGWKVTGLARPADREFVRSIGADPVDTLAGVYDAVIDAAVIGADAAAVVRAGGTYVGVIPGASPASNRATIVEVSAVADGARLGGLLQLAADGELPVRLHATKPLDEFADALAAAAEPGLRGKIVLVP